MKLIQILLPLFDNHGRRFPRAVYRQVRAELATQFTGLTAYSRVAAEGLWRVGKRIQRDDIVVYEVMTSSVNRRWWRNYRRQLEHRFRQDTIVIRAENITVI